MIRFINVSLMRGTKPLLEGVDLTLNPGDKIGLIGANGAGKSSLFGMLRNELHPDQGAIDFPQRWRMAYVAQETPALDRPAVECAIDGDVHLRTLQAELEALEAAPHTTENGIALGEIHSHLADADAYTVQSRAEQLLIGLGFTLAQMQQPVASFSGFERQRAAALVLAAAAFEKQQRTRAHLQSFVDRFKAQATKARQAQSRMKALAKMEELAPLRAAAEFSFEFRDPVSAPNPLLVMEDVDAGYRSDTAAEKKIVSDITFSLQTGQRIGLLGVNGAGKSTFIKTVAGDLEPLSGDTRL